MSEETHNNKMMVQYLLGALPESETARFDELSITDDGFAGSLQAAEKDLVDAYVQGELDRAERERFVSYYLVTPHRREQVKFAEAFQEWAVKDVAAEASTVRPREKGAGWFTGLALFGRRPAVGWVMVAAALILFVAAGALLLQNLRLRERLIETQARHDEVLHREQDLQQEIQSQRTANSATEQELARLQTERERLEQELAAAKSGSSGPGSDSVVSFILSPPMRGVGQLRSLSIPSTAATVKMRLELEADYPVYRVVLVDSATGQTLWRSGSLKPKEHGQRKTIDLSFPASLVKSQTYALRVTAGAGEQEIVGEYPFRVVR